MNGRLTVVLVLNRLVKGLGGGGGGPVGKNLKPRTTAMGISIVWA